MSGATYFGVRWMLKLGKSSTVSENPLSPRDLAVLQETAARLLHDIRTVTDDCVARIDAACERAQAFPLTTAQQSHQSAVEADNAPAQQAGVGSVSELLSRYPTAGSSSTPDNTLITQTEQSRATLGVVLSGELELANNLEKLRHKP